MFLQKKKGIECNEEARKAEYKDKDLNAKTKDAMCNGMTPVS